MVLLQALSGQYLAAKTCRLCAFRHTVQKGAAGKKTDGNAPASAVF